MIDLNQDGKITKDEFLTAAKEAMADESSAVNRNNSEVGLGSRKGEWRGRERETGEGGREREGDSALRLVEGSPVNRN